QPHASGQQPDLKPPAPFGVEGFGFYMTLAEPIAPIPPGLGFAETREESTELHYYTSAGKLAETGRLTRTVALEGYEDIDTPGRRPGPWGLEGHEDIGRPAGQFTGCLSARGERAIWRPLGPVADLSAYVWLTREGHDVRHVQRLSGCLWTFGFRSAHEYVLES